MSTRSVVARKTGEDTFVGRYIHFDGYPSGVGQSLWSLWCDEFPGNIEAMLTHLIDEHPSDWSSLGPLTDYGPGDPSEKFADVTEQTAIERSCVYAYVFDCTDAHRPTMAILVSVDVTPEGSGRWKQIAKIHLMGNEPDWYKLDKKGGSTTPGLE